MSNLLLSVQGIFLESKEANTAVNHLVLKARSRKQEKLKQLLSLSPSPFLPFSLLRSLLVCLLHDSLFADRHHLLHLLMSLT